MIRPSRTTAAITTAAATALLAACGTAPASNSPTSPTPTRPVKQSTDPATTARHTQFTQIQDQMSRAMTAAGLNATTIVNLHPSGTLTGTKYCLHSYLLPAPENHTAHVAAVLEHTMQADGWTPDTNAGADTIALDHGDWTITISHQTNGTDIDPATGKIRTGPMTFFQAKNTTFDCS